MWHSASPYDHTFNREKERNGMGKVKNRKIYIHTDVTITWVAPSAM